jgi:glycosyltransferase involved in cell wall biosynthesis
MKVLHISAGNLFGGIETILVTLARERRLCPDLKPHFSVCFEDRFSRELRATGAPVDYVGNVRVRNPFTIFRARAAMERLLTQESIDVAICHSPWAQAVFGPVVKARQIPLVFWSHGLMSGRHWLEIWARRTPPSLILCNSRTTERNARTTLPNIPTQVIYAPVSSTTVVQVRESSGTGPVVIIQVSRMEKWKGQELLLDALSRLKDLPNWVCWIVGGAQTDHEVDYEDALHQRAAGLAVDDRVEFLGSRDDVHALLAQADIFCQPNLSPEPFGIVFIEALQAGIPVVSTHLGGAAEILNDSCSIMVPPLEPEKLSAALRSLILDSGLRLKLGLAGPARAAELCDPANQLGKLRDLLQALF